MERVSCFPKVKDLALQALPTQVPPLAGTQWEECPQPAHLGLNKSLPNQAGLP